MKASVNQPKLYCSPVMLKSFALEQKTPYLKTEALRIEEVLGGIVHPLEWNKEKIIEDSFYGGVTDSNFSFIPLSLTKRVSPSQFNWVYEDWFFGAKPGLKISELPYVDEDVVFIGALSNHYGHFILEGLSRLWVYFENGDWSKKAVYISESGDCRFNEFFSLFGLRSDQVVCIHESTRFKSVTVPEQSIRLHDFYHEKYKNIIDKIKASVVPKSSEGIFFSKKSSTSSRAVGENFLEDTLFNNNYLVLQPENLGAYETIAWLMGCKELVASSGTNAHNGVFLPDGARLVCINRSAHFHPIQTMINEMKDLKVTYIDLFIWSSDANFGDSPCFLFPTEYLFAFLDARQFKYRRLRLYGYMPIALLKYALVKVRWIFKRKLAIIYEKAVYFFKNKNS